VLSFLPEAREAPGSETPRVHHATRWRGYGVAARGADAAGCDAGDSLFSARGVKIRFFRKCRVSGGQSKVAAVEKFARPDARTDIGVPAAIRVALLRQHGTFSQAYSATFQAGLEHFGDNRGFLAYKRVGRTALVLSDPLAPPENIPHLISRFLHENPDTYFWHVSPRVAQILAERGFYINAMGPENWIELPTYTVAGEKKKQLRQSFNRMVKRGFVTRECTLDEVGIDRIKAVSDVWRQTRTIRHGEVEFLTRPLVLAEELDVRRFFTFDRDGKLVAFAFFDPIYEAGNLVGYGSQHNRYLPEADHMINFASPSGLLC
jgi:lysylphosphatidylglycerol synthetase-like protein (DUF2156 family)